MKLLVTILIISVNTSVLLAQQTSNLISYEDIKRNSPENISILKPNSFEIFQSSIIVPDLLSIKPISEPQSSTIQNWKLGDSKKRMDGSFFGEVIKAVLLESLNN